MRVRFPVMEATAGARERRAGGAEALGDVERLHAAGLSATGPRLAVLAALREAPGCHRSVEDIAAGARRHALRLSTKTVYESLHAFTRAGITRRIEPAGGPALYETRVGDNHHHVVCRSCGRVTDVDCAVGAAPCLVPSSDAGYALDEAEVTFWGTCPDCWRPPEKTPPEKTQPTQPEPSEGAA